MVKVATRPGSHVAVRSTARLDGSDAARTTGTLSVPFALLKPLLTEAPVKRAKRRRPEG
jgi:hypothetical protein